MHCPQPEQSMLMQWHYGRREWYGECTCTFVHIAHTTIGVRINAFFAHGNYLVSTNYCSTYILAAEAQKKLIHTVRNVQAASSIENYVVRISLRQRKGKALTMLQQISQFFIHSSGTLGANDRVSQIAMGECG